MSRIEDMDISQGTIDLTLLLCQILFIAHLLGCVWHYVANVAAENNDEPEQSWLVRAGMVDALPENKYIASIYWVVSTVMSVGYGDIYATSVPERLLSIFTEIVGACFFGLILVAVDKYSRVRACGMRAACSRGGVWRRVAWCGGAHWRACIMRVPHR